VRVLFVGNCADYSPAFLSALVARSLDATDPVSLQGVICPVHFGSRQGERWFRGKRRVGRLVGRVPASLADALRLPTAGVWQGIDQAAVRAGAEMFWPTSLVDPAFLERVQALRADVAVVAGLNRILKAPTLAAFPPTFNIHPSLLPDFRGATPEFWQLDQGVGEGGVTLHRIDAGIDTGPIVLQRRFAIEPWLDVAGLLERCIVTGVALLGDFLRRYPEVVGEATTQSGGSSQPAAGVRDHVVEWTRSAEAVFNRARAAGWASPLHLRVSGVDWAQGGRLVARADLASGGDLMLQLYEPRVFPAHALGAPGELLRVEGGGLAVSCNPGTVVFRRVETASGVDGARELT
jgi:methionyl-tRNA formyltransferase